jgi:hypothetical protein
MERSVTLFLPLNYVFHKYIESHEPSVIYTANSERYMWQTIDDKLKRISLRFLFTCAVSCEYNLTYGVHIYGLFTFKFCGGENGKSVYVLGVGTNSNNLRA